MVKTTVSKPVSKNLGFVSAFYERNNENGFWEIRCRFPKIPFVSFVSYLIGETRNENLGSFHPDVPRRVLWRVSDLSLT